MIKRTEQDGPYKEYSKHNNKAYCSCTEHIIIHQFKVSKRISTFIQLLSSEVLHHREENGHKENAKKRKEADRNIYVNISTTLNIFFQKPRYRTV